ncbi:MAG: hypothetical protein IAG10_27890 [Planctomycetaceae bacterium]|nr:hypothetical protein [Planctomycetaceae bacterium]
MSWQSLPDWIEQNERDLLAACEANGERLVAAADEVDRLWTALTDASSDDRCRVARTLQGLMDLLLELPQTRLLVAELFGGMRLHPAGQPTAEVVARTLKVVHNVFIQTADAEREENEELALRCLQPCDPLTEETVASDQGGRS